MNSYFLVEGETERKVYEKWVQYQFLHLRRKNLTQRRRERRGAEET